MEPNKFELKTNTIWSFPERGDWATHTPIYKGNWSPYIPRNLILRYTKEADLVLDQFAGSGTTLIEAKLLNRNTIGVDINPDAVDMCYKLTNFECENSGNVSIVQGDARNLDMIENCYVDFICTHPPYANIIKYSNGIEGDLSNCNIKTFLSEMKKVAAESYRVLKKDKYCAVLMGDTRQKGYVIPLGFETMKIFELAGFKLKEIIIKEQHNCSSTNYWRDKSIKFNFLLLAHEYLFVFKK